MLLLRVALALWVVGGLACGGDEGASGVGGGANSATSGSTSTATTGGSCIGRTREECAERAHCAYVETEGPDTCGAPARVGCFSTVDCNGTAECASGETCGSRVHACAPGDCASCEKIFFCSTTAGHD